MLQLIALVPLLPLIGFLINGIGYKRIPKSMVGIIGSTTMLLSFIISLGIFFELRNSEVQSHTFNFFQWIKAGNFDLSFSFLVDPLSTLMLLIVTGVGFLIHVYSIGYMHDDAGFGKFFAYLNLFVFFMLLLVLGANYAIMFIGWEGVGLCSYLLIGFWYKNESYNNAAKKAFVMNRIGDLAFLLGMFLIFTTFDSISYDKVFAQAAGFTSGDSTLTAIAILLFIGAMGKSAQLPLYTWLPDAMAGPTPVSALIHAATMVTAGIYMIARSSIIYVLAPVAMDLVAIIGMLTAVWAALIALTQTDIKKVLAYSTVSQLGYMFVALGVGSFTGAVFHLMTHAFFKALLFLGAGSVIHAMSGEQDMRSMGGLRKKLPITFLTILIGTLAIAGVPPFAGFFSKDEILAASFGYSIPVFIVMSFTSVLTAFYMFRMLFLTFYGSFRGTSDQAHHLHESPKNMTIPLMILAVLSTVSGFIGLPEIFSEHHSLKEYLQGSFILSDAKFSLAHASHTLEYSIIGVSIVLVGAIFLFAKNRYDKNEYLLPQEESSMSFMQRISYNKFYIDEFYNAIITQPLNKLSVWFYQTIDKSGINGLVNLVSRITVEGSKNLRTIQTGYTGFYLFAMVAGIIIILLLNFILS
jgi:NADH-quinone oxidoreductase subunit L